MIQRIQSLYLLLATIAMSLTLFLPIASVVNCGDELTLKAFQLASESGSMTYPTMYMGILLALSTFLSFVIIFLFKHRMLQIRLCGFELVVLLGDIVFEEIYSYLATTLVEHTSNSAISIHVAAIMPIIAIILVSMAMKAIFKDELLIRSLNRIR